MALCADPLHRQCTNAVLLDGHVCDRCFHEQKLATMRRGLTSDQQAALAALRETAAFGGWSHPTVDLIAPRTAGYMQRTASGGRRQMGQKRLRATLRELADIGYVVEVKRGCWRVHAKGDELSRFLLRGG